MAGDDDRDELRGRHVIAGGHVLVRDLLHGDAEPKGQPIEGRGLRVAPAHENQFT